MGELVERHPHDDPRHAQSVSRDRDRHRWRRVLRNVRRTGTWIRCAQAISEAVQALGLEIRAGLHTVEVETIDDKVGGIAITIGAPAWAPRRRPGRSSSRGP